MYLNFSNIWLVFPLSFFLDFVPKSKPHLIINNISLISKKIILLS